MSLQAAEEIINYDRPITLTCDFDETAAKGELMPEYGRVLAKSQYPHLNLDGLPQDLDTVTRQGMKLGLPMDESLAVRCALLRSFGFREEHRDEAASTPVFNKGFEDFLFLVMKVDALRGDDSLQNLIILSGGDVNTIRQSLAASRINGHSTGIKVIGNSLGFDETGKFIGYDPKVELYVPFAKSFKVQQLKENGTIRNRHLHIGEGGNDIGEYEMVAHDDGRGICNEKLKKSASFAQQDFYQTGLIYTSPEERRILLGTDPESAQILRAGLSSIQKSQPGIFIEGFELPKGKKSFINN